MIDWMTPYLMLEEEDKKAADEIINTVVEAIASKEGGIVMLVDTLGTGHADFLYGGNALLVEPLLRAGGSIGEQYFAATKGMVQ